MTNCLSRNSCGLERSSGNTLGGRASRIVTNCTFLNAILVVYCPPFTTGPSIVNSSEIFTTHPPTSGTKSYCAYKSASSTIAMAIHHSTRDCFCKLRKEERSISQPKHFIVPFMECFEYSCDLFACGGQNKICILVVRTAITRCCY